MNGVVVCMKTLISDRIYTCTMTESGVLESRAKTERVWKTVERTQQTVNDGVRKGWDVMVFLLDMLHHLLPIMPWGEAPLKLLCQSAHLRLNSGAQIRIVAPQKTTQTPAKRRCCLFRILFCKSIRFFKRLFNFQQTNWTLNETRAHIGIYSLLCREKLAAIL